MPQVGVSPRPRRVKKGLRTLARILNRSISVLPRNILVPTDLSEGAEEALDYACELATKFGAKVHLLNVIGVPAIGVPELGVALTSSVIDSIIRDNQAALERLAEAKKCAANIGEVLLRTGDARDVINQAAKDLGADLIVMGTHGRRGVARWMLGSVAERVARVAQTPVLLVHFDQAEQ